MKRILLILVPILLLAGCVPAADGEAADGPAEVITVNGPTEDAVSGLPEAVENLIKAEADCCSFEFHWAAPVRAQERQRDLNGYLAPTAAGKIVRSLGADRALLVSSTGYERTVEERRNVRYITVTAAARAVVVTADGTEVAEFTGRPRRAERREAAAEELVSERQEPLLLRLATESAADFAVDVTDFLYGAAAADQRK